MIKFTDKELFGEFHSSEAALFLKISQLFLTNKIDINGFIVSDDISLGDSWMYVYYLFRNNYDKPFFETMKGPGIINKNKYQARAFLFYRKVIEFLMLPLETTINTQHLKDFVNKVLISYPDIRNPISIKIKEFISTKSIPFIKTSIVGLKFQTNNQESEIKFVTDPDEIDKADMKLTFSDAGTN